MLWIATAIVIAIPRLTSLTDATNVAMPSGKLCTAIARADRKPVLRSLSVLLASWISAQSSMSSTLRTLWGFSASGTSLSIRAAISIPKNSEATATP